MMSIWEPLSKVVVAESNSPNIKPGATGFVVLLTDDAMGFRSYWGIDLILTRNGKKGQRHLFYRRTRIKKLEYSDLFKPSVIELISKEMLYEEGFEPRPSRKMECIKLEKEPYKSKDILDWDMWDFLGWVTAASQLCHFMMDSRHIKDRIRAGLPTISRPSINAIAVGPQGIDIMDLKAEELIGFFLYMPTDKPSTATLKKAFNDKVIRFFLIEKMRRAFAYGQSIYTTITNEVNLVYDDYLSDLSRSVTHETNPDKKMEAEKMKKDPYAKANKTAKNTWNRVTSRYINNSYPPIEPVRDAEQEQGFVHSDPQHYVRVVTLGGGSVTLSSGSINPMSIDPPTPTPTRMIEVELESPPPLIHIPTEQLAADPEGTDEEYIEEEMEEDADFDISEEIQNILRTVKRRSKKYSGGSSADNR
jgi:hypothetical protein